MLIYFNNKTKLEWSWINVEKSNLAFWEIGTRYTGNIMSQFLKKAGCESSLSMAVICVVEMLVSALRVSANKSSVE